MNKQETLSKGEELLTNVLDECLEEDLSFVPPEREIARTHRFSQRFEEAMKVLLERSDDPHRQKEIRKHFHPRYAHLAACILVFCVCGGLFYYVIQPFSNKGAMESLDETAATTEAAAEESAPAEAEPEEAAPAEAEPEEAAPVEGAAGDVADMKEEMAEAESEASLPKKLTYCGQTVKLAEQQEVPEYLDYVTTLVNCPVLDEENPVLYLTIGNTGEEEIQYLNRYDMEVWIDGGWYVIPSSAGVQGEWVTLEPGMAVDEEINVADYQIDYEEQQYRLITYVGEDMISAEFTFEEVFKENMEELEEQEASGE